MQNSQRCGSAPSAVFLSLSRAFQGIGGAIMFATGLAILSDAYRGKDRGVAFGVFGATTGVAVAVGPVLGGALILLAATGCGGGGGGGGGGDGGDLAQEATEVGLILDRIEELGESTTTEQAFITELRHRFKPEVEKISDYLGRDLVSRWGYDQLD